MKLSSMRMGQKKTYDYVAPVPSVKPRQELDYDPHVDPQLVRAGKKERTSFEVTHSLIARPRANRSHTIIDEAGNDYQQGADYRTSGSTKNARSSKRRQTAVRERRQRSARPTD
jgi:hypothetical protein